MFEKFSKDDIDEVIEVNKMICLMGNDPIGVDMEVLNEIFYHVNSFNDIEDRRERIIQKATYILAGICYNQPFYDGNRRTSHYLVKNFLGRNLFQLRFYNSKNEDEYANLLKRTAEEKFEDDPTIYTEVKNYLNLKVEDVQFDYL